MASLAPVLIASAAAMPAAFASDVVMLMVAGATVTFVVFCVLLVLLPWATAGLNAALFAGANVLGAAAAKLMTGESKFVG